MTTGQNSKYPPKGLLRIGFRLPVYLYRLKLGWLLGGRFVLINHLGRKTGLPRQAVVEVVERDLGDGSIIVVAGYGPQTQWYQNLRAHPETIIQIGNRKIRVVANFITPEAGEEVILRYIGRYGNIAAKLFAMMGYEWDGSEIGVRRIARESLRFVRFVPDVIIER
jgi:deazaflavin-dependent oxidoreductase (nitroreductase family)